MNDYRRKSWWLETLPDAITPSPKLNGRKSADVVVIGGGDTGLSAGICGWSPGSTTDNPQTAE